MTRWTAIALLAALASLPLHAAGGPDGRWTTPRGEMRLHLDGVQVDGRYNLHGGRLNGRMEGKELTGYWIQEHSEERCSRSVAGSPYWGRLHLTFDGDRFDGTWSYCDRTPDHSGWSGTRIAAGSDLEAAREDPTALVIGALAKAPPSKASRSGDSATETKAPPGNAAVTLDMAKAELFPKWRASILDGHPKMLTGDLTCDGAGDYFVGWSDLGDPVHPRYHIAVVYHDGDRLTHRHTTLDLGGDGQYALCVPGPDATPEVTLGAHGYSAAERTAHGLPERCAGAVRLDDGLCDALYIGWEPVIQQFLLERN
ncbi:hypothetical protein [Endothiovibrio diazotrophicus]